MNNSYSDFVINFLINNNDDIFNKIVRSVTFENKNERQTRSSVNKSHACKYTQFILMSLCLIINDELINLINNYDYIVSQRNKIEFNNILSSIGSQFNNIYFQISNQSPIKNSYTTDDKISYFDNEMLKNATLLFDTFDDSVISNVSSNYIIIPLCLYYKHVETERIIIVHYFTIIIDKKNNIFYINSSYGTDEFCAYNRTTTINKSKLLKIINVFNNFEKNDDDIEIIEKFVEKHFLYGIDNETINRQMREIINCNIGYIIEYAKTIKETFTMPSINFNFEYKTLNKLTGKKRQTKKSKKTKTIRKNIKSRSLRSRSLRSKSLRSRSVKTKR